MGVLGSCGQLCALMAGMLHRQNKQIEGQTQRAIQTASGLDTIQREQSCSQSLEKVLNTTDKSFQTAFLSSSIRVTRKISVDQLRLWFRAEFEIDDIKRLKRYLLGQEQSVCRLVDRVNFNQSQTTVKLKKVLNLSGITLKFNQSVLQKKDSLLIAIKSVKQEDNQVELAGIRLNYQAKMCQLYLQMSFRSRISETLLLKQVRTYIEALQTLPDLL